MERLTYNDGGCWQVHGADENICKKVCEDYRYCKSCPIGRAIDRLAEYENKGLEPSEVLTGLEMAKVAVALTELERWKATGLTVERAAELGKADQEGRVVIKQYCPVKKGDTVYTIRDNNVLSHCVIGKPEGNGWMVILAYRDGKRLAFGLLDIGKTVFLTREEAEKALEAENRERL